MIIGLEIETILNKKIVLKNHPSFHRGGYHDGDDVKGLSFWEVENDSSLNGERNFSEEIDLDEFNLTDENVFVKENGEEYGFYSHEDLEQELLEDEEHGKNTKKLYIDYSYPCEFVSKRLRTKTEFNKAINQFIKYFSNEGKIKLKDVLYFNKSTGNHFHISFNHKENDLFFNKMIDLAMLERLRGIVFKKLKKSNLKNKKDILEHYFRNYARKIKNNEDLDCSGHHEEFNLSSEMNNKGFEYRSLNLLNCDNWKDFKETLNIYYDSLKEFEKLVFNGTTFKSRISITQKDKREILDYNLSKKVIIPNSYLKEKLESYFYNVYKDSEKREKAICDLRFFLLLNGEKKYLNSDKARLSGQRKNIENEILTLKENIKNLGGKNEALRGNLLLSIKIRKGKIIGLNKKIKELNDLSKKARELNKNNNKFKKN